jgi:hypothetical protein
MDEGTNNQQQPVTFNGPLEAGLRAVALLEAAYPRAFDIQRLVALDYILVHTGDLGGPASLHPPAPFQSAEMLVRRKIIERALMLMMARQLVERDFSPNGIQYRAGENATPFLASLTSEYLVALKERAAWITRAFADRTESDFEKVMRQFFDRWVEEFQAAERSLGAE